jgi:hypothetical protein
MPVEPGLGWRSQSISARTAGDMLLPAFQHKENPANSDVHASRTRESAPDDSGARTHRLLRHKCKANASDRRTPKALTIIHHEISCDQNRRPATIHHELQWFRSCRSWPPPANAVVPAKILRPFNWLIRG